MTKQIGKSLDGKWVIVEDKVVIQSFDTREEAIEALKIVTPEKPPKHQHEWGEYNTISRDIVTQSGDRIHDWISIRICKCGAVDHPDNEDAWATKHLGWRYEYVTPEETERRRIERDERDARLREKYK